MWRRTIAICCLATWLGIGCGPADPGTEEVSAQSEQPIVRGTPVPISDLPWVARPYVVMVLFQTFDLSWTACSGSYFAPRVVLTAAHCVPPQYVANGFVYWGNDFETDIANVFDIPPPGEPSVWAKLDSWQVNPGFLANYFDADLAVVYLDRKPPFDPLPLYRNRLDSTWTNQLATLVGWGANKALSKDIQETEGFGIKRTGKAPILGTPSLADYEPTPEERPLLTPTVRSHSVELNGRKPHANPCSGDSGGPIIVNKYGQDYVAGVASRTGSWCENFSFYTRIDPYLPFLDDAYRRGGQANLIPSLDCVDTRTNGKLAAYFGYKNDNGIAVQVPYDNSKNYLPLDVYNERPSTFKPGEHRFQVGIDFRPGQTVYWKLSPPNGPTTELRVTAASPRCADSKGRRVARSCEATLASECAANFNATWDTCINPGLEGYDSTASRGCEAPWIGYLNCVASVPPAAANWDCEAHDTLPRPFACQPQLDLVFDCLYPPAE